MTGTVSRDQIAVGLVLRCHHRYSDEDIDLFAEYTGLAESPARIPDVLVFTPVAKLAGDMNLLARDIECVYHDTADLQERISTELEVTAVDRREDHTRLSFSATVRGENGRRLLTGTGRGTVLHLPEGGS